MCFFMMEKLNYAQFCPDFVIFTVIELTKIMKKRGIHMIFKHGKRFLAGLLICSLVLPLSACKDDNSEEEMLSWQGKKNVTIDSNSKWVNSSIDGMIDNNLKTNIKDDFYSYINKDWILKQSIDQDHLEKDFLMDCEQLVKDRKIAIVSDQEDKDANAVCDIEIDPEELSHNEQILQQFTAIAGDWKQRNALGLEPVIPYLKAIDNISSIEEMADYIADIDGNNISGKTFFDFQVDEHGIIDTKKYRAMFGPTEEYSLLNLDSYINMGAFEYEDKYFMEKIAKKVLSKCGYSAEEIKEIFQDTYSIECQLADAREKNCNSNEYYKNVKKGKYTIDQLQACAGKYPISDYIKAIHYDKASYIYTAEIEYLEKVGQLFHEGNLKKLKSYYILHTALYSLTCLDRASYDLAVDRANQGGQVEKKDKGRGDERKTEVKDEWDLVLNQYVSKYLAGPLDIVYVSKYCNSSQKKELTQMVNQLIDYYKNMIDDETWLSKKARKATKEKLEAIKVNVLYPDHFDSYMGIQFDPQDSLIQMVQKIKADDMRRLALMLDEKVDHSNWNLSEIPTTTINAQYMPTENSICIFAGIVADGTAYREGMSEEDLLARIGVITGHEISHAFDTTGSKYDKYGNEKSWWSLDDTTAFEIRAAELMKYYNDLKGYPDSPSMVGMTVSGEVIADMGGMKSTLQIAKSIEGFDYDQYFKSFAELWRSREALYMQSAQIESDPHPVNFLRVNVTLMQFDEFYKTYQIKKSDGMYMAPEKRIAVW